MKLLLAVVYFFVEMFCIVEFADEFGILVLFLEIIVSAILGFGVMFGQYSMLPMAYSEILNGGIRNFIGRNILRLIGAILLIIPGILCDIIGFSFVVVSLFFITKEQNCRNQQTKYEDGNIIDVEIIEDKK